MDVWPWHGLALAEYGRKMLEKKAAEGDKWCKAWKRGPRECAEYARSHRGFGKVAQSQTLVTLPCQLKTIGHAATDDDNTFEERIAKDRKVIAVMALMNQGPPMAASSKGPDGPAQGENRKKRTQKRKRRDESDSD